MTRFLKRHTPVVAALLVLVLGGSVAAMAAGGTSQPARAHHHQGIRSTRRWKLTQSAAAYIGISTQALETDLRSGKSLGQVATEAGKSETGLVQALTATSRAGLEARIAHAVKKPGGIGGRHVSRKLKLISAEYLGVTPTALAVQLKSGRTLGQVADSTPGHSRAGLIDGLLAARAAKGIPSARQARLRAHITRFVDHPHPGVTSPKSGT